MKSKIYFFTIIIIFSLSCGNHQIKEEKITGTWKLKDVKTNQIIANPEQYKVAMYQLIKTTSIQLNTDKSFTGTIWGDTSFGYWQVKNDSLVVNDLSNNNQFSVFIKELTPENLVLIETVDSVVEIFTFVK